jgi:hypothetical protein
MPYLSPLHAVQVQAHLFGSQIEHFRQTPILQSENKTKQILITVEHEI